MQASGRSSSLRHKAKLEEQREALRETLATLEREGEKGREAARYALNDLARIEAILTPPAVHAAD